MQIFIKLPEPYSKTILLRVNESCYEDLKYYLIYGTGVINESYDDLSIQEYNDLYSSKKITDELTLTVNIRNVQ